MRVLREPTGWERDVSSRGGGHAHALAGMRGARPRRCRAHAAAGVCVSVCLSACLSVCVCVWTNFCVISVCLSGYRYGMDASRLTCADYQGAVHAPCGGCALGRPSRAAPRAVRAGLQRWSIAGGGGVADTSTCR